MLLAVFIGGCRGVYLPLPVVVGGFGVVCGFSGLLALGAGTAMSSAIHKPLNFVLYILACVPPVQ